MDHADLERLVKLMNENDLVELEIEEEGRTVRLRKAPGVPLAMPNAMQLLPQMQPMHMMPAPGAAPAAGSGAPAPSGPPAGTVESAPRSSAPSTRRPARSRPRSSRSATASRPAGSSASSRR
jgi:biotin carboxyl carrier protein